MLVVNYIVFVFNKDINDKDFALVEARDAYFSKNGTALVENEIVFSELELLKDSSVEIMDIINEHNDSMIGLDEDDIIYSNEIKQRCLASIKAFCDKNTCSSKIHRLIELLDWAIDHDKNVYFLTQYLK